MANRLSGETSPYLLQHAANPVDWQPWDAAALAEAKERDVPLLVSIGYSACHWCHVMEHESFEDPAIAAVMNENFVCIKVDREERPDVDALFMEACQLMTGHGGWPLNAFATPEGVPFWAGTYFPPAERGGMPSWRGVLESLAAVWRDQRDEAVAAGERLTPRLVGAAALRPAEEVPGPEMIDATLAKLRESFDTVNAGFGGAPKFPPHELVSFLLASGEREMSIATLTTIANGGIHDQIGGGFCRYAVDSTWTVPHFEKMLYDNSLLAAQYLDAWLLTGDQRMAEVCRSTLDWMERELLGPEGGFHSALDADDPEGEGRFYSWTPELIEQALADPDDAALACSIFGVTDSGNYEDGLTVAIRTDVAESVDAVELERLRRALFEARAPRPRPATDTKVITSWNALAITAFAQAGAAFDDRHLIDVATACANHLLSELRDADGRLLRCRTDGRAVIPAVLEDHAYLLAALIDLYEATFDERWYREAIELADRIWQRFGDVEHGGFFTTASDGEQLAARRKDLEDQPIPSGNSTMALALTKLHGLSGSPDHATRVEELLRLYGPIAESSPRYCGRMLRALLIRARGLNEVAIVGADQAELLAEYRSRLRPTSVIAAARSTEDTQVALLVDRVPVDGRAAAYVCRNFTCGLPVTEPAELAAALP
jgi:uncharacterized protein YyaL (SSP411 family)